MGFITLDDYESNNLLVLLRALDEIGGFNNGDWYNQIKYKCEANNNDKSFHSKDEVKKMIINYFNTQYIKVNHEDNTVK